MYGGWLNAICLKAALEVSGSQYPHPLTLNIDFISGVKKGDSICELAKKVDCHDSFGTLVF